MTAVPSGAGANPEPFLFSVACQKPGVCVAVGDYTSTSGGVAAMTVSESHGRWIVTGKVLPPPNTAKGPSLHAVPRSVWCPPTGHCVMAGNYQDTAQSFQGNGSQNPGRLTGAAGG